MLGFSPFKKRANKFNYTPRYYDPEKEAREQRRAEMFGQELRREKINAPIIFLTTSQDHALEAFGVGATQYILKPFEEAAFFSALDVAMERVTIERRRQLVMKTVDGLRMVNIRDIIYAESHDKLQEITLMDKTTLTLRLTLSELSGLLSPYSDFVQCGAA